MKLGRLLTELAAAYRNVGDVPVAVRHNHQSYHIARDSIADVRDEEGTVIRVSIAAGILPIDLLDKTDEDLEVIPEKLPDMTELVRGMDPSWYMNMLLRMATDYPEEFYAAYSNVISDNARKRALSRGMDEEAANQFFAQKAREHEEK